MRAAQSDRGAAVHAFSLRAMEGTVLLPPGESKLPADAPLHPVLVGGQRQPSVSLLRLGDEVFELATVAGALQLKSVVSIPAHGVIAATKQGRLAVATVGAAGTEVLAYVSSVRDVEASVDQDAFTMDDVESNICRCPRNSNPR